MPRHLEPRLTISFIDDLAQCDEERPRVGAHARKLIMQLQAFPDMGAPQPRASLRKRYGEDIRTMPVDSYLLVYSHDESVLELIALIPGVRMQ